MAEEKKYKYDAFISYRHLEPDASVAEAIHKMVESYKAPKELYKDNKAPTFRVFRDRDELTVKDLNESIVEALEESRFLIVIVSRRTKLSPWCLREIDLFRKFHGDGNILPVLIEGEPSESFPNSLLSLTREIETEEGGKETQQRDVLAAELRPKAMIENPELKYENMSAEEIKGYTKETLHLLKDEKYRIMASMLGVTYGDLKQRDKIRKTRQIMVASAISSVALLFFGIFMFQAYQKEAAAKREVIQQTSQILLETARKDVNDGNKFEAVTVANQAVENLTSDMNSYTKRIAERRAILNDVIYNYSANLLTNINTENKMSFFTLDQAGKRIFSGYKNNQIGVWDAETGKELATILGHKEQVKIVAMSKDDKYLASGAFDNKIMIWDATTYQLLSEYDNPGNVVMLMFTEDNQHLISIGLTASQARLSIRKVGSWEEVASLTTLPVNTMKIRVNPVKMEAAVLTSSSAPEKSAMIINLMTGEVIKQLPGMEFKMQDGTSILTAYRDIRYSNDGNSLYLINNNRLEKRNIQSFDLEMTRENKSYSDNYSLKESPDGSYFYINSGAELLKVNTKSGETMERYSLFNGEILDYKVDFDRNRIVLQFDTGDAGLIMDGNVIDKYIKSGLGVPEEIYLPNKGDKFYSLSRVSKQIKIFDYAPRNTETKEGQNITTSLNGRYTVIYQNERLVLYDNVGKTTQEIKGQENLGLLGHYIDVGNRFRISGDGKSLIISLLVSGKNVLGIMNTETGDLKQVPVDAYTSVFEIARDSSFVYAASSEGVLKEFSLDGQLMGEYPIDSGNVGSIVESQDANNFVVNYLEGRAVLYQKNQWSVIGRTPGRVFTMNEGVASGIYINEGFQWKDGKATYHSLPEELDEIANEKEDTYYYDSESGKLLTIRISEDERKAYLIDFPSGELIKTFPITFNQYEPNGYIHPGGKAVSLDQIFDRSLNIENPDGGLLTTEYKIYQRIVTFPLFDDDKLLEEANKLMAGE